MSAANRREFLQSAAALGVAAASRISFAKDRVSANDTIVLAMMGTNGRGAALTKGFVGIPGVQIAYICDVDERAIAKGIEAATSAGGTAPKGLKDFREALEDKGVDALVCAAPNHWHAPATILACSAGKHVYVEKPCSHNPREGELMVEAARKNNRVVQIGTQRRSSGLIQEVRQKIQEGAIGKVHYAQSWYTNRRPTMGKGMETPVPTWLDYSLWQGPAPERPFINNMLHYNWHWRWHYGNGELGNNGIHSIDVCRWVLEVDYPTKITSSGGRYRFDDDQETPDTQNVSFEFDDATIAWQGLSCASNGFGLPGYAIVFHGEGGTLCVQEPNYKIYDLKEKEVATGTGTGPGSERAHQENFLSCIRSGERPNADVEEGHKSTLLCHLGNIAQRTGHTVHTDPSNGHIKDDPQAEALWSREYRPGWEPKV
jgi:predicted dehydrogenase